MIRSVVSVLECDCILSQIPCRAVIAALQSRCRLSYASFFLWCNSLKGMKHCILFGFDRLTVHYSGNISNVLIVSTIFFYFFKNFLYILLVYLLPL